MKISDILSSGLSPSGPQKSQPGASIGGFSGLLKSRAADLSAIFKEAAEKYGLPQSLLEAVAKAESNFNPSAVSKAGAVGVMQLMPGTARSLGVSNPFDPYENVMGGARYLSGLISRYNGDLRLALAAYNAGPGAVDKYGGVPPYPETRAYVEKVLGLYENAGEKGVLGAGGLSVPSGGGGGEISNEALGELMKNLLLSGMLDGLAGSASLFGEEESGEQHILETLLRMQLGLSDGSGLLDPTLT